MPTRTAIGAPEPVTLTAAEAAELLGYTLRTFTRLSRTGHLPGPIDPALPARSLRWSRRLLEDYAEGRWAA